MSTTAALPPIVDAHIHFRDPDHLPYELVHDVSGDEGRVGTKAVRYLPEQYFADMADLQLAGFIHIEAEWSRRDPAGESSWLAALRREGRTRDLPFAVVGFADLADAKVEAVLAAHAAVGGVVGIRQMLSRVPDQPALCWADRDYLDDPLWRENYGLLGKYELHFDAMCFGRQMPAMAELAGRHPDIPLHLEHAGLPWDHTEKGREVWRDGMRNLARLPHADVKVSGLGNTIANWTVETIRPYVLETIDIFGVNRVAFASNFPTDRQFSDCSTIWKAFSQITKDFNADERSRLFAANACEMYKLELI